MPIEKPENHNVEINKRNELKASGVEKVEYLSDEAVLVNTAMGKMAIKGESLHIEDLNSQSKNLYIKGKINSVTYLEKDANSNWIKRIFR